MKKRIMLFLACIPLFVYGQISTEELPYSWINQDNIPALRTAAPTKEMPPLNMKAIESEDEENDDIDPYRFGIEENVNFNLSNSGVWVETKDGGRLWTLKISSPDALSLHLLYDKFWLPEGAKLYIYSSDKKQHIGAFTSMNNIGTREDVQGFATGLLYTDEIVLEYYEPIGVEAGIISVARIVTGYRGFPARGAQLRHNNTNYSCHIDVNCAQGANYQKEKNAVAYQVMGGYLCTGALLNTTANDFRPYYLTAEHCFVTNTNTQNWIFYWNYEASSCEGTVAYPSSLKSTSGATLLARRNATDFTLLELIGNPMDNANIVAYYLGWDRSGNTSVGGAGIHHPNGAQKKISIENDTITNYPSQIYWTGGSVSPANSHWRVYYDQGTTEGGSSGSPLLDQNKRVIGQLHGGSGGCPPNVGKYYGRLDVSWSGGTGSTQLRDWLDPLQTSVLTTNGRCKVAYYNGLVYNSGTSSLVGCEIEMSNVTVQNSNTALNVTADDVITLKSGFIAKEGTLVKVKIGSSSARSSVANVENGGEREDGFYLENEITTGEEIVTGNNLEITGIKAYSVTGILLYASRTNFNIMDSGLENGVYILENVYDNGSYKREKVVLKRF